MRSAAADLGVVRNGLITIMTKLDGPQGAYRLAVRKL